MSWEYADVMRFYLLYIMINLLGHIQVVIIVRTKEVLWMSWEYADVMFILMLGIC